MGRIMPDKSVSRIEPQKTRTLPSPPPPGQRVTDEIVRHVLTWARNYEEIESFRIIAKAGRKWQITLPKARLVGSSFWIRREPQEVAPREMVFTSREALAFAYGCAAGGIHDRTEFAADKWGWERLPDSREEA